MADSGKFAAGKFGRTQTEWNLTKRSDRLELAQVSIFVVFVHERVRA